MQLPARAFKTISWREGEAGWLTSRFARIRVRSAHRDYWRSKPHPEQWLLIEWPSGETEPTKYSLNTLPATTTLKEMVDITKLPWRIERDYQDLKQEIGLGHFEGRGWRGFHHHATLSIAAYGFLVLMRANERAKKTPPFGQSCPQFPRTSARAGRPVRTQRHNPLSLCSLRIALSVALIQRLERCPCCLRPSGERLTL